MAVEAAAGQARAKKKKVRGSTRERIVLAAARLAHQQGFNATSLDAVAQAAGVNRGSLYYFFRSKKNLALAVIAHFEALLYAHHVVPAFGSGKSGREKLETFAALYARMPSASSPCCGCPIGNLSLELSGADENLRARLEEVWRRLLSHIEEGLRQAQAEGDLESGPGAAGLARSFFTQIQGAHLIARSTLDARALEADCRRAFEGLPWRGRTGNRAAKTLG
jgi:TetR/AcrR family transcriptional repressor of nem operon